MGLRVSWVDLGGGWADHVGLGDERWLAGEQSAGAPRKPAGHDARRDEQVRQPQEARGNLSKQQ